MNCGNVEREKALHYLGEEKDGMLMTIYLVPPSMSELLKLRNSSTPELKQ
jgi:hypothetical protein